MRNCCASRAERVLNGNSYFYRVLPRWGMARATMELRPKEDEPTTWQLVEARGSRNATLSPNLIRSLAVWLAQRQRVGESQVLTKGVQHCLV